MGDHVEHDHDEISATGDLWKQSITGGKLWSLRKFVLTNVYMVYYNKKGEKRGQWDISDCLVRSLTAEEAGSKSAQNAFCIAGPRKLYLFNANSPANRSAWMRVIEEQIEEFKDPDRRFIRTGEVIYGKGNLKKRNMLGMGTTVRMLLTNYPRIMVIDPVAKVRKQQITWRRDNPPIFTKLSTTRFKITHENVDLHFEDVVNKSQYWEDIFKRFPQMRYFVPRRRNTLTIDFNDYSNMAADETSHLVSRPPPASLPQTEANLRLLREAQSNLHDLVNALNSTIDEIDVQGEMGVLSFDQHEAAEQSEGKEKKTTQLKILKDNVTVLSQNLDTLIARDDMVGLAAIDVPSIQAVITETTTMINMFEADNDDDDDEEAVDECDGEILEAADERFSVDIQNMDAMVAELEQETLEIDGVVATVEALSYGADSGASLDDLEATYNSLDTPEELVVTPENFSLSDVNRRPTGWKELRMKRVLVREYVSRLEGVSDEQLKLDRDKSIELEEQLMIDELKDHGQLLNTSAHNSTNTLPEAAIAVTKHNFNPVLPDLTARPPAWRAIRLKRVLAKEEALRRLGVDEDSLFLARPAKVLEEEQLMLQEVALNGQVKNPGFREDSVNETALTEILDINPENFSSLDSSRRPPGWAALRAKRVLAKERAQGLDRDKDLALSTWALREAAEEELMVEEVCATGALSCEQAVYEPTLPLVLSQPADSIIIDDRTYNAENGKRPHGWAELRTKRVLAKERHDRLRGVTEDNILQARQIREAAEEALMKDEVVTYGKVLNVGPSSLSTALGLPTDIPKPGSSEWVALTAKRSAARELRPQRTRAGTIDPRNRRDLQLDEDNRLADELAKYGTVLELGMPSLSAASEVEVNNDTFDPLDEKTRPAGWAELRKRRVLVKERVAGMSPDTALSTRIQRELDEESEMVREVLNFVGPETAAGGAPSRHVMELSEGGLSVAALDVEHHSLDSKNPTRPPGWAALRAKRVHMKEKVLGARLDGALTEERERAEELLMIKEAKTFGSVFDLDDTGGGTKVTPLHALAINTLDLRAGERPTGWVELRAKRVLARERAEKVAGVSDELIFEMRAQKFAEEESQMIEEVENYGAVLHPRGAQFLSALTASDVPVTASAHSPITPTGAVTNSGRSNGWTELRARRVQAKERAVRDLPTDAFEALTPNTKLASHIPTNVNSNSGLRSVDIPLDIQSVSQEDTGKRPGAWKILRKQRVKAKEAAAAVGGKELSDAALRNLERTEEAQMLAEKKSYGRVLAFGGPGEAALLPVDLTQELTHERPGAVSVDSQAPSQTMTPDAPSWAELKLNPVRTAVGAPGLKPGTPVWADLKLNPARTPEGAAGLTPTSPAWAELKLNRVRAKETAAGLTPDQISKGRDKRLDEEENSMLSEIVNYIPFSGIDWGLPFDYGAAEHTMLVPSDVAITPGSLDADEHSRPSGWRELRTKRVLLKERGAKVDMSDLVLQQTRPIREAEEEKLMLQEIDSYGHVLDIRDAPVNALSPADNIVVTPDNFDPNSPSKRPPNWVQLRGSRVHAKELAAGVDRSRIPKERLARIEEEEDIMLQEVAAYGFPLAIKLPLSNPLQSFKTDQRLHQEDLDMQTEADHYGAVMESPDTLILALSPRGALRPVDLHLTHASFDPSETDISKRTPSWIQLRARRVNAKERAVNADPRTAASLRLSREQAEDLIMVNELLTYGHIFDVPGEGGPAPTDLVETGPVIAGGLAVNPTNFDPADSSKRPEGWNALRSKRVYAREDMKRSFGMSETALRERRSELVRDEEKKMVDEATRYGRVLGYLPNTQPSPSLGLKVTSTNYDPARSPSARGIAEARPKGWAGTREKRVLAREAVSGPAVLATADEEEENGMKTEAALYGSPLTLGGPGSEGLSITSTNYNPAIALDRPVGWASLRDRRVNASNLLPQDVEQQMIDEVAMYGEPLNLPLSESDLSYGSGHALAGLTITADNFDSADPTRRPENWGRLRTHRVLLRERHVRVSGVNEGSILEDRQSTQRVEEERMIKEVHTYGTVLGTELMTYDHDAGADTGPDGSILPGKMAFGKDEFDPNDSCKRPAGWFKVRGLRVDAKETIRGKAHPANTRPRAEREAEEEQLMLAEVAAYGEVLSSIAEVIDGVTPAEMIINSETFSPIEPGRRPIGWPVLRARRVSARERQAKLTEPGSGSGGFMGLFGRVTGTSTKVSRVDLESQEDKRMIDEYDAYGYPLALGAPASVLVTADDLATMLDAAGQNADVTNLSNPSTNLPDGWNEVRNQRILLKEAAIGAAVDKKLRPLREKEEDAQMRRELSQYGRVLSVTSVQPLSVPVDIMKREEEWLALRSDRVHSKEWARGVDPRTRLHSRPAREQEENASMSAEIAAYGTLFATNYHSAGTPAPASWARERLRRVLAREAAMISADQQNLQETRLQRLEEEDVLMRQERSRHGSVLSAESWGLNSVLPDSLVINTSTFHATDSARRPIGWTDVRRRRVYEKEYAAQLNRAVDTDEDSSIRVQAEEMAMIEEVTQYGSLLHSVAPARAAVLGIDLGGLKEGPSGATSVVTTPEWVALLSRRVAAKEEFFGIIAKADAGSDRSESLLKKEEELMLSEAKLYGKVFEAVIRLASDNAALDRESESATRRSQMLQTYHTAGTPLKERAALRDTTRSANERVPRLGTDNITATPTKATVPAPTSALPSDLIFTPDNFDPADPTKRPEGWIALRQKRIVIKEQIARVGGVDEDTIAAMRDDNELEEEDLMLAEVAAHGCVLGGVRQRQEEKKDATGSNVKEGVAVDEKNFDPELLSKRPHGWNELRIKRVMLKEHMDRLNGKDESVIMDQRRSREVEEELAMIDEARSFGRALAVGETSRFEHDMGLESPREKLIKKQFQQKLRLRLQEQFRKLAAQAEAISVAAAKLTPTSPVLKSPAHAMKRQPLLGPLLSPLSQLVISNDSFSAKNPSKRPEGWDAVRLRRVHRKEQLDRLRGVDEQSIVERRTQREAEEEAAMVAEVERYGNVLGVGGIDMKDAKKSEARTNAKAGTTPSSAGGIEQLVITTENYDPKDPTRRPEGWSAIRGKRVYRREQLDRLRGISDAVIKEKRPQKEQEEEQAMQKEVAQHGHLLGLGGGKSNSGTPVGVAGAGSGDIDGDGEVQMHFDPSDFDLTTNKRPKGWAMVKLRRVYVKEWKDRKEGLDEEEIMEKRYQREQDVEQEMIQEMTVNGRIRAFERAIQRQKKIAGAAYGQGFQRSLERYKTKLAQIESAPGGNVRPKPSRRASNRSNPRRSSIRKNDDLNQLLDRTNASLGTINSKMSENLTPPQSHRLVPGPRIVAPRSRPLVSTSSQLQLLTPSQANLRPSVGTGSTDRASEQGSVTRAEANHVRTLGISSANFSLYDDTLRPKGWTALRHRRVQDVEAKDRRNGMDEMTIERKRDVLIQQIEGEMMSEATLTLEQLSSATPPPPAPGDETGPGPSGRSARQGSPIAVKSNPLKRSPDSKRPSQP